MTRRAWPWSSTAASGGPARPRARRSVATLTERTVGGAGGPRRGHRPHPLGHPRRTRPRRTPTPTLDCTGRLGAGPQRHHREPRRAARPSSRPAATPSRSGTDTEVMAHLIEDAAGRRCLAGRGDPPVLRRLRGRLLHRGDLGRRARHHRGRLPASRRSSSDSSDGMALLASDIPALIGRTRRVFTLADDQMAVLTPGALRGHDPRRGAGRARGAHHHLGRRGGAEGRLRRLHVQGDARAARAPSATRCSTGAAPTASWSSTRCG